MKIYIFFWKAIKIAGSAQKINRVGRVSGNTGIFLGLIKDIVQCTKPLIIILLLSWFNWNPVDKDFKLQNHLSLMLGGTLTFRTSAITDAWRDTYLQNFSYHWCLEGHLPSELQLSLMLGGTLTFRTSATISPPCLLDCVSTWNREMSGVTRKGTLASQDSWNFGQTCSHQVF